jgi:hypothetical protein
MYVFSAGPLPEWPRSEGGKKTYAFLATSGHRLETPKLRALPLEKPFLTNESPLTHQPNFVIE